MKKLSFTLFFIALASILTCKPAFAQNKAELQAISDKMYADGDLYFILVQAYHDEMLFEGQSYDVVYKNGIVTINDQVPPAPFAQKYNDIAKAFYKGDAGSSFSLKGGGLTLAEITNPESGFRKNHAEQQKRSADMTRGNIANENILNQLAKDNLVDTAAGYNIIYNHNGFMINGKKLEGAQFRKYRDLYVSETGHDLYIEENGSFSMTKASKTKK